MQDLYQALQMFQQGVQQTAVSTAVNDATRQMQELNQANIDEGQKRQALQQLSNQTALRLTGAGANGTQIQSAFNAIAPQNFGSAEQMQLEGQLSGNKQLMGVSSGIIGERDKKKADAETLDFNRKAWMQKRTLDQELLLAMAKMKSESANTKLSADELGFQTNVQVADKLINDLDKTIENYGTAETGFGSTEAKDASAKLDAIPYQLAITYAKIVDPASVAREGEVDAAKKYMLNLGAFSSPEKARLALKNMRETIKTYQSSRSATQGAAGGKSAAPAPAPQVKVMMTANGPKKIAWDPATKQWRGVK